HFRDPVPEDANDIIHAEEIIPATNDALVPPVPPTDTSAAAANVVRLQARSERADAGVSRQWRLDLIADPDLQEKGVANITGPRIGKTGAGFHNKGTIYL
ncbi:hypothetical protein N0V85_008620, partial [Neurospora sp. IMI 360204]